MTYRQLIEAALVAVIDAVNNPDNDAGLASAEKAIALLKPIYTRWTHAHDNSSRR